MARRSVKGFNYRHQKGEEKSVAEWREEIKKLLSRGGFRRVEGGETFGHEPGGLIAFEVYANIQVKEG